jgi:hypothetical protein
MRFSTAPIVGLERSFRHGLKFLLLAKIVRLNAPLGYVKKALAFIPRLRFHVRNPVLSERLTGSPHHVMPPFLTHLTVCCFIKVLPLDHWKTSVLVSASFPVQPRVSD